MTYETIFRCKWLGDGAKTVAEIADHLREAARELDEMAEAGIALRAEMQDDYAFLETEDAEVAERFGLEQIEYEEEPEPEDIVNGESEEGVS